jgi:ribosomal silencing factor RsfS
VLKTAGRKPLSVEGYQLGEWLLIDFGEIVVHLFQPAQRALYSIEKLWQGNATTKVVDEELRQMKKKRTTVQ